MALIPARSGSKGVPHKNIRNLGGHPIIKWSIGAANASNLIDRVVVSTDSREYADLAVASGAEVPFLRPPEISGDTSTDYDFIMHALDWFAEINEEPNYIVHIRPTTPFRDPERIDQAIKIFMENSSNFTALRSVHPMSESAYKAFEISASGQLKRVCSESTELDLANNARQLFPETYTANGYVDVLSSSFIRKASLIHGDNVFPFVTPVVSEIDTEDDFSLLEFQLQKNPEMINQIFGEVPPK
jgi:N-acylneuraminate cytidylyltransferase